MNSELPDSAETPESTDAVIMKVDEAEADEMRSSVGSKANQRWLWHATDHKTGAIPAHTPGKHEDKVFAEPKKPPEPFGVDKSHTDRAGVCVRHADPMKHEAGRKDTRKIGRKHLTLRTRIKRLAGKTVRFSKLERTHDIVIGLFINKYEFWLAI